MLYGLLKKSLNLERIRQYIEYNGKTIAAFLENSSIVKRMWISIRKDTLLYDRKGKTYSTMKGQSICTLEWIFRRTLAELINSPLEGR